MLGRALEQLVGQVPQGPGDRDLVPDLGDRRLPVSSVTLAASCHVGWCVRQQDDIGAGVVPCSENSRT